VFYIRKTFIRLHGATGRLRVMTMSRVNDKISRSFGDINNRSRKRKTGPSGDITRRPQDDKAGL
jgi:hypothetical protein